VVPLYQIFGSVKSRNRAAPRNPHILTALPQLGRSPIRVLKNRVSRRDPALCGFATAYLKKAESSKLKV
jgi:hypothetical protein